jgi:hypothetical protein
MTNHYHLLVETPRANLSRLMHYLNGAYTNYLNRKRRRSGHLFQGRYKAIVVERESHLLELSRYLHLNPVRARLLAHPEDYPYSSFRAYVSRGEDDLVERDLILGMMSGDRGDDQRADRRGLRGAHLLCGSQGEREIREATLHRQNASPNHPGNHDENVLCQALTSVSTQWGRRLRAS